MEALNQAHCLKQKLKKCLQLGYLFKDTQKQIKAL